MLERLTTSFNVLVLGLGAAFIGLTLLIIFVQLMHKVVSNKKGKDKNHSPDLDKTFESIEKAKNHASTEKVNLVAEEDEKLIAVISAAVAAALNRSTHDIIVRSVKRIEFHSPVWNRIGRQEQIGTRL